MEFIYYFHIFCRTPQSQQKLVKKITHLTMKFREKNLTHSTKLNWLNIIKSIIPWHSQKYVSGCCQKKHLHCTISRRPRTTFLEPLESRLYRCIYMWISVRKCLFRILWKLLPGGELNNSLQADRCSGLVKCFRIFHFNWNFWKLKYFLAFRYFHQ